MWRSVPRTAPGRAALTGLKDGRAELGGEARPHAGQAAPAEEPHQGVEVGLDRRGAHSVTRRWMKGRWLNGRWVRGRCTCRRADIGRACHRRSARGHCTGRPASGRRSGPGRPRGRTRAGGAGPRVCLPRPAPRQGERSRFHPRHDRVGPSCPPGAAPTPRERARSRPACGRAEPSSQHGPDTKTEVATSTPITSWSSPSGAASRVVDRTCATCELGRAAGTAAEISVVRGRRGGERGGVGEHPGRKARSAARSTRDGKREAGSKHDLAWHDDVRVPAPRRSILCSHHPKKEGHRCALSPRSRALPRRLCSGRR